MQTKEICLLCHADFFLEGHPAHGLGYRVENRILPGILPYEKSLYRTKQFVFFLKILNLKGKSEVK